jgi:hypothetical protein
MLNVTYKSAYFLLLLGVPSMATAATRQDIAGLPLGMTLAQMLDGPGKGCVASIELSLPTGVVTREMFACGDQHVEVLYTSHLSPSVAFEEFASFCRANGTDAEVAQISNEYGVTLELADVDTDDITDHINFLGSSASIGVSLTDDGKCRDGTRSYSLVIWDPRIIAADQSAAVAPAQ